MRSFLVRSVSELLIGGGGGGEDNHLLLILKPLLVPGNKNQILKPIHAAAVNKWKDSKQNNPVLGGRHPPMLLLYAFRDLWKE